MIVTCEACFTSFNVNDELIKASGPKVRCSKCHKVFKVYPPIPEDIEPSPLMNFLIHPLNFLYLHPFLKPPTC